MSQPHIHRTSTVLLAILLGMCAMIANAMQQPPGFPPTSPPQTQPSTQPSTRPTMPALPEIPSRESLFVQKIELAHGRMNWETRPAIRADVIVEFGGSTLLEGTLTFEQSTGRSRFDLDDGTTLVFDGSTAWVSPQSSPMQGARFHVLTWPYFMAAPFKLDDEGVRIELHGLNTFNNNLYESAKLTFEPGVGDSPDDWYILFIDNRTPRLAGMVYIVTYGQSLDEAEKEPHAIVYEDYRNINGVNLSTRWTFHDWDEVTGLKNPPLGSAQWSNLEFITPEQGTFDKPADAREDAQP